MYVLVFLAMAESFWWKNEQRSQLVTKRAYMYQKLRVFFNLKYPRICAFFSNSDFAVNNLNLSQLRSSSQSSPTYLIKYPFVRIRINSPKTSVRP